MLSAAPTMFRADPFAIRRIELLIGFFASCWAFAADAVRPSTTATPATMMRMVRFLG
jgi:hypothetical protein